MHCISKQWSCFIMLWTLRTWILSFKDPRALLGRGVYFAGTLYTWTFSTYLIAEINKQPASHTKFIADIFTEARQKRWVSLQDQHRMVLNIGGLAKCSIEIYGGEEERGRERSNKWLAFYLPCSHDQKWYVFPSSKFRWMLARVTAAVRLPATTCFAGLSSLAIDARTYPSPASTLTFQSTQVGSKQTRISISHPLPVPHLLPSTGSWPPSWRASIFVPEFKITNKILVLFLKYVTDPKQIIKLSSLNR